MASSLLKIDPDLLSPDGKQLTGTQPATFFALDPTDTVQAVTPVEFDLTVSKGEEDLFLVGSLKARFKMECGRCLQSFLRDVILPDYATEIPIETQGEIIDLTDTLREDILLALPSYPRCEDGNVEPRECPAQGRFDAPSEESDEGVETAGEDKGVWDVLDHLKNR